MSLLVSLNVTLFNCTFFQLLRISFLIFESIKKLKHLFPESLSAAAYRSVKPILR